MLGERVDHVVSLDRRCKALRPGAERGVNIGGQRTEKYDGNGNEDHEDMMIAQEGKESCADEMVSWLSDSLFSLISCHCRDWAFHSRCKTSGKRRISGRELEPLSLAIWASALPFPSRARSGLDMGRGPGGRREWSLPQSWDWRQSAPPRGGSLASAGRLRDGSPSVGKRELRNAG